MNPKRCSCSKSTEKPKKEKQKKDKTNTYKKGALEYEKLKSISYENLMYDFSEDKFCGDFINDFKIAIETLGVNFGKLPFPTLMKTVLEHPKWLDFLKDHDYIAEYLEYDVSIGEIFLVGGRYKMITGNAADGVISLLDLENGELEDTYPVDELLDRKDRKIEKIDSLIERYNQDVQYWEGALKKAKAKKDNKESLEWYIDYLKELNDKIKLLEEAKQKGFTHYLIVGYGDNHGDFCGEKPSVLDYNRESLNIRKDDLYLISECNH